MTLAARRPGIRRVGSLLGPLLAVAATISAYHYSLVSLARGLTLQTPLAYLGLVPIGALLLAAAKIAYERDLELPPLRLDFVLGRLLGVLFIGIATTLVLLVPLSVSFWLLRVDLLSLPIFVAGVVMLLYGVRQSWRLRAPILFLVLAWPVPYLPIIGRLLEWSTEATIRAVSSVTAVVPIAQYAGREGIFFIEHGDRFALSVASACAGVNSVIGFAILGGAVAVVVQGRIWRRLAWVATGVVVVWLLNVLRIVVILAAGRLLGQSAALDILHPVAGLVVFNIAVIGMLIALRRFGLEIGPARAAPTVTPPTTASAVVLPLWSRGVRSVAVMMAIIVAAAGLGYVNSTFARYEPLTNGLAEPQVGALNVEVVSEIGYTTDFVASYGHARPYFGERSSWDRVRITPGAQAPMSSSAPVYIDDVRTDDAGALAAYGLEACYRFHGYLIESATTVDVGAAVPAQLINYHNPKQGRDWSGVAWEWPFQGRNGLVRYERVVIFTTDGPQANYAGVTVPPDASAGRFGETNAYLVAVAREVVRLQLARGSEGA